MKSPPPSVFNGSLIHEIAEKIKKNGNMENIQKNITIRETKKYYSSFIPSRKSEEILLTEVDTLLNESFIDVPEQQQGDVSTMIQSLSENAQFFLKELDRKMAQKPEIGEVLKSNSEVAYTQETPLLEKSFQTLKDKNYRQQ